MQEIWKHELKMLEAMATQAIINGYDRDIERGKLRAKEYQATKNAIDKCINIISKYSK